MLFDLLGIGEDGVGDGDAVERRASLITGGRIVDQDGERGGATSLDRGRPHRRRRRRRRRAPDGVTVARRHGVRRRARIRRPPRPPARARPTRTPRRSRSASRAAALGGYTAVVAMPNTDPPADARGVVELVRDAGARGPDCATSIRAAASRSVARGEQLAPFAELVGAGVRLFTDDGNGVQDPLLMRRAMEYSLRPRHRPRPALRGQRPHRAAR